MFSTFVLGRYVRVEYEIIVVLIKRLNAFDFKILLTITRKSRRIERVFRFRVEGADKSSVQ
jgi:hypothetical protein